MRRCCRRRAARTRAPGTMRCASASALRCRSRSASFAMRLIAGPGLRTLSTLSASVRHLVQFFVGRLLRRPDRAFSGLLRSIDQHIGFDRLRWKWGWSSRAPVALESRDSVRVACGVTHRRGPAWSVGRTDTAVQDSSDRRARRRRSGSERVADDRLRFVHDALQMSVVAKALGVDLVDVLGARRARCEPALCRYDLDAAERRVAERSARQHPLDRIASEFARTGSASVTELASCFFCAGVAGASTRRYTGSPKRSVSAR